MKAKHNSRYLVGKACEIRQGRSTLRAKFEVVLEFCVWISQCNLVLQKVFVAGQEMIWNSSLVWAGGLVILVSCSYIFHNIYHQKRNIIGTPPLAPHAIAVIQI